ncbi:MAG: hypothetical protein WEA29_08100 [Acidimicrobiia bacterium]
MALVVAAAIGVGLSAVRSPQRGTAGQPVEAFTHIHGLEVAPWAPRQVFLATHLGLIVIDEAGAWAVVSEEAHDLMGFRTHPSQEGVLYASGHPAPGSGVANPVGFRLSRDGGRTWESLSLEGVADFHAMAADHRDGRVIYGWNVGRDPGFYRSGDGGQTWERLDGLDPAVVGGVFAVAVHPDDPNRVLAGTEVGIVESLDAGGSWRSLLAGYPVTSIAWAPDGGLLAYLAHPDGGLVVSLDHGASWTSLSLILQNDAVAHIAPHPADPEVLYVGTFGETLLRTTDGGRAWELLAQGGVPLEAPQPVAPGG